MMLDHVTRAYLKALATLLAVPALLYAPNAQALPHSRNVAYVFDFGVGFDDPHGPYDGSANGCVGSSIFNWVIGPPPAGGHYVTSSGNAVDFTNVPVSAIDAGGADAISGFDTVILYEVCDFASHPVLVSTLNAYLRNGRGKVVIFDGDRCAANAGGLPDYSGFIFPFTSSNPGTLGNSSQTLTFVETESTPNTLTYNLAAGQGNDTGPGAGVTHANDAVGDSNAIISNAGSWCSALGATNALAVVGIQEGYARTAQGGLAIYNGQDFWCAWHQSLFQKQIFDNILDQPFLPDYLPCGVPVSGIKLDPATATNPIGTSHTVTASITDSLGNPISGQTVTFVVNSGPNAVVTATSVTNAAGQATFTYPDTGGAGTDTIEATFVDSFGTLHTSNTVTKTWASLCGNGTVEGSEQCDLGTAMNGQPGVCCTATCTFVTDGTPCDDGNACTAGGGCGGGICHPGTPVSCDDGNACTNDECVPATGCVHTNNTASCNDDNACTTNDACSNGTCVGGAALNCDDNNLCTNDSCSSTSGCVHINNTAACDDGNPCTVGDVCSGGTCHSGTSTLSCNDNNPCTDDSCNPSTGCFHSGNASSCTDGNACTVGDTCGGGTCQPGAETLNCDDGNPCTIDTCDPASGCKHVVDRSCANQPPVCTAAIANPGELWPPNNGFVPVRIAGITDPDGGAIALTITAVLQDEPIFHLKGSGHEGRGTNRTVGSGGDCPDARGLGSAVASLRAERDAQGDGRVYHIRFSARDGHGGTCTGEVAVCVPHDQSRGHACLDEGALYDSTGPCLGQGQQP